MGRIRVLSDAVVNRIAAGEVVERPASVVKELVENSIDAGARTIVVRCEAGGVRRIVVEDDGSGMDRDDALLAFERHATSKIRQAGDLDTIGTLGFRGEALASIGAVARVRLETAAEAGWGTEVELASGTIRGVREISRGRGTTIEVARLFLNVPARRKFLRSEATELAHLTRVVTRVAVAAPALRVHLLHDERALVEVEPAPDLAERLAQIYGRDRMRKLLPVERRVAGLRVTGFAGRPADSAPRRDGVLLFVNGRPVQDRLLSHAVAAAYANTMPGDRSPWAFLFVEIPAEDVDVNVHPQKVEVRFRRPGDVHDAVRDAIEGALGHAGAAAVPTLVDLRPQIRYGPPAEPLRTIAPTLAEPAPERVPVADAVAPRLLDEPRVVPLAQYDESYIVATDGEGLLLVDQHAAHERVLFERLLDDASGNRVEVQRLMFPLTVELSAGELLAVEREAEELRRLGFLVEPFGGASVRIDGVPALAADVDPPSLLRELAGEAARLRAAAADAPALRLRLVTTAACRAAIKVHHALSQPEMQRLLDDLFGARSPTTCPHGRPVVFRLSHAEIERAFRRR